MNLVLFGPPGSGKGTQSELVCEKFHLSHLSTGEAMRAAIRAGTDLGKRVKAIVERGELVPDELVSEVVDKIVVEKRPSTDSFLFDGYPRTVSQVADLDRICEFHTLSSPAIVNLEVPSEILMLRLTGRRLCSECRRTYNVYFDPPKQTGVCDLCHGPLMKRVDDTPETVKERLEVYEQQTKPVLHEYDNRHVLSNIDGTGTTQEVFERIRAILAEQY
ncbi:adenylate kinase [bacterium]|nr:adenylate kinase [bacterium]